MAVLTSHDGSVMPMVADLSMRFHRPFNPSWCRRANLVRCRDLPWIRNRNDGDRRAISRRELISLAFR